MNDNAATGEFTRPISIDTVPRDGATYELEAGEERLPEIAKRLGIPAVRSLKGVITLTSTARGIHLSGKLEAMLRRICVRSLEEMDESVADAFEIEFVEDYSEDDDPLESPDDLTLEPLEGETIDIADILIQQAAIAMDPYPHIKGAESLAETHGKGGRISPFEVLKGAIAPKDDEA